MIKNKRGLSTVVTTLIIILLVLVAIGIVWVVIRGVIEGGAEQIDVSAKCPLLDIRITGVSGCTANACDVNITRSSGGEESGVWFKVAVTDGATTRFHESVSEIPPLGSAQVTTTSTWTGTVLAGAANKATVTPYFKVAGEDKLCPNSYEYTIST